MATYTTTVESIINSVIVDGQNQTTNRTALLSYANRVQQRMLRESQWLFLKSQPQSFITQPGASSYFIGTGAFPSNCVSTGLALSDLASIIPDSVYDRTNSRKLTQDSPTVLRGPGLRYPDGTFRPDRPRTYNYDYNLPGVLNLYPPPDGQSTYQPVPLAPICNYFSSGALVTTRNYYVWVTLVDSNGGESTPSLECNNIEVPAFNLLTVSFNGTEIQSANKLNYNLYNVYVGSSPSGPGYLQNTNPLPIGYTWQEPATGIVFGNFASTTATILPDTLGNLYSLTVSISGQLQTTLVANNTVPPYLTFLKDSSGGTWFLEVQANGSLVISKITTIPIYSDVLLQDVNGQVWSVAVNTSGQLTTTAVSSTMAPSPQYPVTSTITPLDGYIISFQYLKTKTPITESTQFIQIPDDYTDVFIAGVNYYANLYTSKGDDLNVKIGAWKKEFMDGLAQMRRDLRINFRNTDVLMPDSNTQYQTGTQTGFPYYFNS